MDFLKILKSFEEFVYEALLWVILLPQTLVRILVAPRRMCDYVAAELAVPDEKRFGEAMSPPLLLILCVLIAHLVDLGLRTDPVPGTAGALGGLVLGSEQNLLLYRTIAFGLWSLAGAAGFLLLTGTRISRETLRGPFYEQCYLVAPFALLLSVAASLLLGSGDQSLPGALIILGGTLWYAAVQVDWIRRRTRLAAWRALLAATAVLLVGALANFLVGIALTGNPTTATETPGAVQDWETAPRPAETDT